MTAEKAAPLPQTTEPPSLPRKPDAKSRRYWLSWVVKLIISICLLYLAAHNVDLKQLGFRLAEAQTGPLTIALMLMFAAQIVGAVRLATVMRAMKSRLSLAMAVRYQFVGLFFNSALPSSVGGDAMRIWLLTRAGFRFERALGAILVDRSSAVVALVAIVALAQPIYGNLLQSPVLRNSILGVLVALLLVLPAILALDRLPAALLRFRLFRGMVGLVRDARCVYLSWRHAVPVIGMSVLIQLMASMIYYFLAGALMVDVPFLACAVLLPVVILVTTLPISVGGWGVREAATVTLFGAAGVDPKGALLVSVSYGIAVIIIGIPGGVVWLLERTSGAVALNKSPAQRP